MPYINNQFTLHRSIDLIAGFTGDTDVVATQINTLPVLTIPDISPLTKLDVFLALYNETLSAAPVVTPTFTYTIQPIHLVKASDKTLLARQAAVASKNQWDVVSFTNVTKEMILKISSITIAAQAAGIKLGVFTCFYN